MGRDGLKQNEIVWERETDLKGDTSLILENCLVSQNLGSRGSPSASPSLAPPFLSVPPWPSVPPYWCECGSLVVGPGSRESVLRAYPGHSPAK